MNLMREPKIKKLILSAGATGTNLDKSVKLFKILTGMNPQIIKAGPKQRIPSFGVRPELPLGTRVTIRGKKSIALLKKLLGAVDNSLNKKEQNTSMYAVFSILLILIVFSFTLKTICFS